MIAQPIITAFLPTTKPAESKEFYSNTLGLKLVSEDGFALEFEGKGSILRVTIVDHFVPHSFTVLGFSIENIEGQVKALTEAGLHFIRYVALEQDDLGIWTAPSQAQIAWFEDPDGNLISLTEYPDKKHTIE